MPILLNISHFLICIKADRCDLGDSVFVNEQPLIDVSTEKIIALSQETQFAPNGIVSRTLLRTPSTRVVLFGFAEGQELTEHTSTQHALIQVLSGECEFFLAGKKNTLKAGQLLYMPPHLPHSVKATQQFSMLLTLFKPERANSEPEPELVPEDKVMDVRPIPCSIKHGLIFDTWNRLAPGDYFVLLNDHDPVPLRYQFEAEFPGAFTWEYLERGPEDFRVKITKTKHLEKVVEAHTCGCSAH